MIRIIQKSGTDAFQFTSNVICFGSMHGRHTAEYISFISFRRSEPIFQAPITVGDYTIQESTPNCGAHALKRDRKSSLYIRQDELRQGKDEKIVFLACATDREGDSLEEFYGTDITIELQQRVRLDGIEHSLVLARQERPGGFIRAEAVRYVGGRAENWAYLFSWERNLEIFPMTDHNLQKTMLKLQYQTRMNRLHEITQPFEIAKAESWIKIMGDVITIRRYIPGGLPEKDTFHRDHYKLDDESLIQLQREMPEYERLYQLYQSRKRGEAR